MIETSKLTGTNRAGATVRGERWSIMREFFQENSNILDIIEQALANQNIEVDLIRGKLAGLSLYDLLEKYYHSDHSLPRISRIQPRLTDIAISRKLDKFIPHETAFHTTSALTVARIAEGGMARPSSFHESEDIRTTRGVGLGIMRALMRGLGVLEYDEGHGTSLGHVDLFVFSSPKGSIDGEGFIHEQRFANSTPEFDQMILNLVLDGRQKNLHPTFMSILKKLEERKIITNLDELNYIQSLREIFYLTQGLRYSWYERIYEMLTGVSQVKIPNRQLRAETIAANILAVIDSYKPWYNNDSDRTSAVIIEFNPRVTVDGGVVLLPIDDRNWNGVVMTPFINGEAVKCIYCDDKQDAYGMNWRPLASLGNTYWAKGEPPSAIDISQRDPRFATCGLKYAAVSGYMRNTVRLWAPIIRSGEAVPLTTSRPLTDLEHRTNTRRIAQLLCLEQLWRSILPTTPHLDKVDNFALDRLLAEVGMPYTEHNRLLADLRNTVECQIHLPGVFQSGDMYGKLP